MARADLALIQLSEPSDWSSCHVIASNLTEAYRQAFGNRLVHFSLTPRMGLREVGRLASRIEFYDPAKLVFLDHAPHPVRLLHAIRYLYGSKPLPPIFVHLYGEFTLMAREWAASAALLKGIPLRFLCASERQAALVSRFLRKGSDSVVVCPFPVDCSRFRDSPRLRERWRRELRVSRDDFVVLYSGRISLQKNIGLLTRELARASQRSSGARIRFWVTGVFDDLGAHLFGIKPSLGSAFQAWENEIRSLSRKFRSSISFLGDVAPGDLAGLYNAADLYANLSLHHDEDFGMAPAEALCSGTPALLTSWGGFRGFGEPEGNACDFVPTRITPQGITLGTDAIQTALSGRLRQRESSAERGARSSRYRARFSINAVAKAVTEVHSKPASKFSGFSPLLSRQAAFLERPVPFPQGPKRERIMRRSIPLMSTPTEGDLWRGGWFHARKSGSPRIDENRAMRAISKAQFTKGLWPAVNPYRSPLNPRFLGAAPMRISELNQRDRWWIRDGLVPLLWFFKANPRPDRLKSRLLINNQFGAWVPDAWREKISFYSVVSTPHYGHLSVRRPASKHRTKLLLAGLQIEAYCSMEGLNRILDTHQASSFEKILLFLPVPSDRLDRLGQENDRDLQSHFLQAVFRRLGNRIQVLNWRGFESPRDLTDFVFVELNEHLLCADTYFLHSALSRGARLPAPRDHRGGDSAAGESIVRLSANHAAVIHDRAAAGERGGSPGILAANLWLPWHQWTATRAGSC